MVSGTCRVRVTTTVCIVKLQCFHWSLVIHVMVFFFNQDTIFYSVFVSMFFKLLNGVFHLKTFYIEIALKYQIDSFFKSIIIKTQLIIR